MDFISREQLRNNSRINKKRETKEKKKPRECVKKAGIKTDE